MKEGFTKKETAVFKKLNTTEKVQAFLDKIPFNFEKEGYDTIKSPLRVIRENNAHCIEGAILGSYILSLHKYKSYLLHLQTTKQDFDHVIVVFKDDGYWGALSKTNHSVLRYRDSIYKTVRELVMSYFHEYFLDNGKKTLRRYSDLLDLKIIEKGWEIQDFDLWAIDDELDKIKHYDILLKSQIKKLSKASKIERQAGKIIQWKK